MGFSDMILAPNACEHDQNKYIKGVQSKEKELDIIYGNLRMGLRCSLAQGGWLGLYSDVLYILY